jgi:lipopolysaccharide/colanic/teichoic acid biosynthesis glycosyltransferase
MNAEILKDIAPEVKSLLYKYVNVASEQTRVMMTTTTFNILNIDRHSVDAFVNLKKINDIRFINKFQEAINVKLPDGGIYIGCVETHDQRSLRLKKKFPPVFSQMYQFGDFVFKRVWPKLPLFKKAYFFLTDGRNRVMSKAESLGRLCSCGFKILEIKEINNRLYFVGQKEKDPVYDLSPSYGPLFTMRRVGKDGKIINIYKFRTMYPYAEYLQEYIYETNNLSEGGKFADDFRITRWGVFLRRFWLDELPMIYNLLKGDLKIVGVRPLSRHYYSLYTKELQEKRNDSKPGLLPPFYVDMPKTLEEIINSELKYLKEYEKAPLKTDFQYFWAILNSIFIKKARSN